MPNNLKDKVRIVDKENREWTISEIPAKLMSEFNDRAAEMYPGKEAPWMHLILDTISSVCDVDKVTYQLTDIPADLMENFDNSVAECDYTRYSIISELLQAAGKNNFVVGRMITEESAPGDSVAVIITGIPVKSWGKLQSIAEEGGAKSLGKLFGGKPPSAMALLALILQYAAHREFQFTFDEYKEDKPDTAKATPKRSVKSRVAGIRRGSFGSS